MSYNLIRNIESTVRKHMAKLNLYKQVENAITKTKKNKKDFIALKTQVGEINKVLQRGGGVTRAGKSLILKNEYLKKIYDDNDGDNQPGWILFILCLIIVILIIAQE